MGFWKKLLNFFGLGKTEVTLLIIGLDNSGKTSIINRLKAKKTTETIPTIAFNVETFSKKNFKFEVIDMSGNAQYRTMWEAHYAKAHVLFHNIRV
jgi:ADP-ribosylation factor-like protein 6